jgi:hypothetical protein
MASREDVTRLEAQVEAVMAEIGVSREAAALLVAVEHGDALIDDVVFDPPISEEERRRLGLGIQIDERIALARRQVQARQEAERTGSVRAGGGRQAS